MKSLTYIKGKQKSKTSLLYNSFVFFRDYGFVWDVAFRTAKRNRLQTHQGAALLWGIRRFAKRCPQKNRLEVGGGKNASSVFSPLLEVKDVIG